MKPRLSRDPWLMTIAVAVAARGTCSRLQVGALVVRDARIVSTGYNGVPAGLPHCRHICVCGDARKMDVLGHEPDCPAGQPCHSTVHAEANALVFAARHGAAVEGCTLVTTHQPCLDCAKMIVNAGIVRVTMWIPYRRPEGLELLERAGVATMWTGPE